MKASDPKHATQKLARKIFDYNPETGVFRWRCLPKACQHRKVGDLAGCISRTGHRRIIFCGKQVYAHRIAWLYMTGEWPRDQIDHINGEKDDNSWVNLREADNYLNQQNRHEAQATRSQTGILGVSPKREKYQARIGVNYKILYLGTFDTPEEAREVYLRAKRKFHPSSMTRQTV